MSVKDALSKYSRRATLTPKTRINKKPEKEVQKNVIAWLKNNGFSCSVVESKATYSVAAGRYLSGQASVGFPDVVGCSPSGLGVFIELKAPGKLSTLRAAQHEFLTEKIGKGAFAVVVDSTERLASLWSGFKDHDSPKTYLRAHLPKAKGVKQSVNEEFGF